MSYEAIEDYLKRGGEIKVLPPAPLEQVQQTWAKRWQEGV